MRKLYLIFFIGILSACNSAPPAPVSKVNNIIIPVVQQDAPSPPANPELYRSLYQKNKQQINNVAMSLKSEYLQDVKSRDIFDVHSETHQVYASLTKLEQMQQMNDYYYKEQNKTGLLSINQTVATLFE
ncbi:hypothetical protein [Citrobacter sp. RHBSTW-00671]|uniref:hypothetical protein n=1 Tax=Citrobacter sp. RHBSTW-00671 TaxID=2742660 RepID=UPI00181778FF|nr:hypothetical protein [Citrobacter sp. RHBSTW-00671]MBA7967508.1 hypothetical protein [Citrobacter sp. RHBSTW-00671]HCJ6372665.1 hypothetical protein [Citrobacter freundii]